MGTRNFIFFCIIVFLALAAGVLFWAENLRGLNFAQDIAKSQAQVSEAQARAIEAQADAIDTSVKLNDELARAMLARERLNNALLVLGAVAIVVLTLAATALLVWAVRSAGKAERGR